MFLVLGLFAYTGCGGPPSTQTQTQEEEDLAHQDMAGFEPGGGSTPEGMAGEGAAADTSEDAGGETEEGGEEPSTDQ